MKVLHIDAGAEMRGGQHQVLLLMDAQREAGHQPVLLAKVGSPLWLAASARGFEVDAVGPANVIKISKRQDIVHAHDAHAHTLALASRKPLVVSRRVAFPVKSGIASKWKYWKAARYLAVSQFVADQLASAGIDKEKIDVVYDAVGPVQPAEPWNPEFPAVALAHRDPEKGRDLVAQASKLSGIEVAYSEDLPKDLRRGSMFVYLTRSEGLGSAALLAMQMGVPVIASKVGGLPEVFTHEHSGLYVNNDPNEVVKAMRRILSSRALATTLIQNGKLRIAAAFTPKHLLDATLQSYRRALA